MPVLTIPNTFSSGTTILSAGVNANFSAIATLLNSTKLDSTNLQTGGVATANLADLAVTTAKIDALAVTTAKIAALNVTRAKMEAVGQQISSSCGTFSKSTTPEADITNLSVSLTTTGRPVFVAMVSSGDGSDTRIDSASSVNHTAVIRYYRDATEISRFTFAFNNQTNTDTYFNGFVLDVPAAGTYTYKATLQLSDPNSTSVIGYKLAAWEL